jgi:PIN domain nuclease of toxin-antitoxin system
MLSERASEVFRGDDTTMYISAASGFEIATKYRLGKLPEAESLIENFANNIRARGFVFIALTVEHSFLAGSFTMTHKDPFDRLIAAQSKLEEMLLLSNDSAFDQFPVQRIW